MWENGQWRGGFVEGGLEKNLISPFIKTLYMSYHINIYIPAYTW